MNASENISIGLDLVAIKSSANYYINSCTCSSSSPFRKTWQLYLNSIQKFLTDGGFEGGEKIECYKL